MPVFCDLPCHCSFNGWPLHELTMLSLLNSSVILSKICCWSEMMKLTVLFLLLVYAQILISVIMCTNFYWLLGGNQGLPSLKINCFKGVLTPNLLHLSVSSDNKCWYFIQQARIETTYHLKTTHTSHNKLEQTWTQQLTKDSVTSLSLGSTRQVTWHFLILHGDRYTIEVKGSHLICQASQAWFCFLVHLSSLFSFL